MIPEHLLLPSDIILVSGKGFISRGIQWCTDSKWSHVALYVGGQKVVEAVNSGVVVNDLQTLCNGHQDVCIRQRMGLPVEQSNIIIDKAYSLVYDKYDRWQLITMGLYNLLRKVGITWSSLVSNSRQKMICSELVGVCYMTAGINFTRLVKMNTPASLYQEETLKTVYEAPL